MVFPFEYHILLSPNNSRLTFVASLREGISAVMITVVVDTISVASITWRNADATSTGGECLRASLLGAHCGMKIYRVPFTLFCMFTVVSIINISCITMRVFTLFCGHSSLEPLRTYQWVTWQRSKYLCKVLSYTTDDGAPERRPFSILYPRYKSMTQTG